MYKYELINHEGRLPIKIFLHNINKYPIHWHEDIEIIFVMDGSIKITEGRKEYVLNEDDVVLINSNVMHSSEYIEQNTTLVMQIDTIFFNNYIDNFSEIIFDCNTLSDNGKDKKRFDSIRNTLARIMMVVQKKDGAYVVKAQELIFKLIGLLISNFQARGYKPLSIKPDQRLKQIVKYINEHYMEDISLQTIADIEHLSPQYISKTFKESMGISFIKYLTSVRLKKSMEALIYSNKNVLDIAIEYGFPNSKSYYKAFKESFSMTPCDYRKLYQLIPYDSYEQDKLNYFKLNPHQSYKHLIKYLSPTDDTPSDTQKRLTYELSVNKRGKELKHTWSKMMTFSRASEGLRAEFQRQMMEVQKEIPFEYVRFHGIFNDDMMVYNEYEDGTPYYNFTYVDELFDFFMRCNIKPFIEIGFMPQKLASNKDQYIFWWKGNVSYPKDLSKWLNLVEAFIRHLIQRYGKNEVLKWYFEIWNEPNINNVFWFESKECFFDFFSKTFLTIKGVDYSLRVGGPAVINEISSGITWYDDFLQYIKDNNINIDFFSYHVYPIIYDKGLPINSTNKGFDNPNTSKAVTCKYEIGGKDFIIQQAKLMKDKVDMYNLKNIEIHMTEFNSSANSRDLVHDTCFMAAFLVHNVLGMYEYADSLGYWVFTDIFEEFAAGETTFHGGLGFITNNGIKKPHYYAYYLLNKLGNEVLEQGESYIMTKSDTGYQILLYNYCHYDELYRNFETSHLSMLDRYNVFESGETQKLRLIIRGLKSGKYIIRVYKIDRENGSAYDEWLKMGAPKMMSPTEIDWIKKKSLPQYYTRVEQIEDCMEITEELKPHGVMLIEIVSES